MTIQTPRIISNLVDKYYVAKLIRAELKYEITIAESQAKLAETTLVPGYTNIFA